MKNFFLQKSFLQKFLLLLVLLTFGGCEMDFRQGWAFQYSPPDVEAPNTGGDGSDGGGTEGEGTGGEGTEGEGTEGEGTEGEGTEGEGTEGEGTEGEGTEGEGTEGEGTEGEGTEGEGTEGEGTEGEGTEGEGTEGEGTEGEGTEDVLPSEVLINKLVYKNLSFACEWYNSDFSSVTYTRFVVIDSSSNTLTLSFFDISILVNFTPLRYTSLSYIGGDDESATFEGVYDGVTITVELTEIIDNGSDSKDTLRYVLYKDGVVTYDEILYTKFPFKGIQQ